MAKKYKTMDEAYNHIAEKFTKKYLKNSNYNLVLVESTTELGEPCLVAQIVKKEE